MQILEKTGLYGAGLLNIKSEELVERYNQALEAMGLSRTALKEFNIDMIGWSPEIADEKENIFYLTHSLANPMAIILSSEQKECPIYFPYHSFDKYMFSDLFESRAMQIMDVTTQEPLWLDMDNGMSDYQDPKDLLLVDSFEISLETPNELIQGAAEQRDLIKKFVQSKTAWEDEEFRNKLIQSGQDVGDLQGRQISMSTFKFSDIGIFFTEAFNGIYVLRSPFDAKDTKVIMIAEDESYSKEGSGIHSIDDKRLFPLLMRKGYLQIDIDYLKKNPELLERKKTLVLGEVLVEHEDNIDLFNITSAQIKGYIRKYRKELPKVFFEIERLEKQLKNGAKVVADDFSEQLQYMVTTPGSKVPEKFHRVLYRLISYVDKGSIINLYRYNKKKFYDDFDGFSEVKKHFVRDFIKKYYLDSKINSNKVKK
jgi:hypothetical protein